ncbi:hypothetical protein CAP35_11680 [Chitinophagaceae bacterium IBVUCB1]|nr:hypothetical protein CAP35_11680 [Chitinophagaceae bacterium IBVUCB1]
MPSGKKVFGYLCSLFVHLCKAFMNVHERLNTFKTQKPHTHIMTEKRHVHIPDGYDMNNPPPPLSTTQDFAPFPDDI